MRNTVVWRCCHKVCRIAAARLQWRLKNNIRCHLIYLQENYSRIPVKCNSIFSSILFADIENLPKIAKIWAKFYSLICFHHVKITVIHCISLKCHCNGNCSDVLRSCNRKTIATALTIAIAGSLDVCQCQICALLIERPLHIFSVLWKSGTFQYTHTRHTPCKLWCNIPFVDRYLMSKADSKHQIDLHLVVSLCSRHHRRSIYFPSSLKWFSDGHTLIHVLYKRYRYERISHMQHKSFRITQFIQFFPYFSQISIYFKWKRI